MLGTVAVTLEQSKHREREGELRSEKRVLKVESKEMELAHQEAIKKLKMVISVQQCAFISWLSHGLIHSFACCCRNMTKRSPEQGKNLSAWLQVSSCETNASSIHYHV